MSIPQAGAPSRPALSWLGLVRLALVQTALGAIFVLSTSTLTRVMVVEFALPAVLPGLLIAIHYVLQVLRPRLGYASDVGGRRTPWIVGGMAMLAAGGLVAAVATAIMKRHLVLGIALAVPGFVLIGLGVGAAGTTLLVLMANRAAPERRAAAATIAWVMMILGFIVTAIVAGKTLDPFSPQRLVIVAAVIAAVGFAVSCLAVWGVEGEPEPGPARRRVVSFRDALGAVWVEAEARRFTIFVFVSMLAYGSEDFLCEPFAGVTFGMTPGQTAALSGMIHVGTLAGMIGVGTIATVFGRFRIGALSVWMILGCLGSAAALVGLATLGLLHAPGALQAILIGLGLANGAYSGAAIGAMMQLVGRASGDAAGVRMGLWGAAQAIALGAGGLFAATSSDGARRLLIGWPAGAYACVFLFEAGVFVVAAVLAVRLSTGPAAARPPRSLAPAVGRG